MTGRREFLAFAAGIFGVPAETVSLETTYASVPEWDSMAQLRLVMEIASRYGTEIPFADVTNVTSLWEFFRRINGLSSKKAIAVDLDNTLWDGVVGEDGPDAIRPRADLLQKLKELKDRGVLLVVLSKNNEKDALDGLKRIEGSLKADDFVTRRINWKSKAENLLSVARELNLGTDAFVFVDDNPAERLEMAAACPEVAVAEFPPRLEAYFPNRELTDEDRHKTEEYQAEAKRKDYLKGLDRVEGLDVWKTLGCWIEIHELTDGEVARVAQLSQKANQFDVCTNRYSEEDVRRLAKEGLVVTAHAGDRFGDQGLVAFVVVRGDEILDWVMSCRVMGRGLEDRVEAKVEELVRARGVAKLQAMWKDSGKNAPVKDLFDRFGFGLVAASDGRRDYVKSL